jgi:prepilin-type N-terminal cleavage/methylation domain-containing protein
MKKRNANRKGFTLAEELVTIILVGILIVSASGIMLSALRIFCRNVITLTAQEKGLAVMEQLEENLNYAKTIGTSEPTGGTYPYWIGLSVGDGSIATGDSTTTHGLLKKTSLKYSESGSSKQNENVICKLGTYDAIIEIKGSGVTCSDGEHPCVEVSLQIQRYGTTYYSENRTVELKNYESADTISSFSYKSDTGNTLYIEFLE